MKKVTIKIYFENKATTILVCWEKNMTTLLNYKDLVVSRDPTHKCP